MKKSLIFIMRGKKMPIRLAHRFEIFRVDLNRPIGESVLYWQIQSKNDTIAKLTIFSAYLRNGTKLPELGMMEFTPFKSPSDKPKKMWFEFDGFKKGDEIKIHYNIIKK